MELGLAVTLAVWTIGGFFNVVAGMGGPMLCMPVMIFFMDLPVIVAVTAVAGSINCLIVALRFTRYARGRELVPLLPGCLAGLGAGVWALMTMPLFWLETVLGVLLILFSAWKARTLDRECVPVRSSFATLFSAGLVSGVLAGAVGLGSPPLAVIAYRDGWDKDMARGMFGICFTAMGLLVVPGYLAGGILTAETVPFVLAGTAGMLLGSALAMPVVGKVPQKAFRGLILFLILAGGLALLYKAFIG